jgi:5-methyltetrahydropteroyltriglutamate--homocysteine methyltransferase
LRRADDQQQRAQGFLTRARWLRPVELRHVAFLRASADRTIQITLRGPFTVSRQAKNEFYKDEEELVMDYAAAVNAEIREPKAAGADVIQLKEPRLQARAEESRGLVLPAIVCALHGIPGPTRAAPLLRLRLCRLR